MGKGTAKRKEEKAAEHWLAANKPAPRTSAAPGYTCVRCGAEIHHPAHQDDHNAAQHQFPGGR